MTERVEACSVFNPNREVTRTTSKILITTVNAPGIALLIMFKKKFPLIRSLFGSRARIKEAIRNGAHTVEAVAKETGATTGSCKGCRCRSKIQELITEHLDSM